MLIGYLSYLDFDSFLQENNGLKGYIDKDKYDDTLLNFLFEQFPGLQKDYRLQEIEDKNWNEEWEKNYKPAVINNQCYIRAEFHPPDRQYEYEIVITPKMSFGTGHHPTTQLMVNFLLDMDLTYMKVLDAGCGTGILSILASLKGAEQIYAYDSDEWAVRNAEENARVNKCQHIEIHQGTIKNLSIPSDFDVVMANINKNILINELPDYSQKLKAGGILLLSGVYETDGCDIGEACAANNLVYQEQKAMDNWLVLKYKKGK